MIKIKTHVNQEIAQVWESVLLASATAQQVAHAIKTIENWNWRAGYSFAHIVLGDYNLDDGSIDYCLNHVSIDGVARPITKHEYEALSPYDQYQYDLNVELRDTTISLLVWLKATPELSRDDAWVLVNGFDKLSDEDLARHPEIAESVMEYRARHG